MKLTNLLQFTVIVVFIKCTTVIPALSQENHTLKEVEWLVGVWVNETERGNIYERWISLNPHEMTGTSFYLKEQDTVLLESIRLIEESQTLYYIPTVVNQNDAKPIRFTLTHIDKSEVRFENPDHDFPQVITYRRINDDSLIAEISSLDKENPKIIEFSMKRMK